MIAAIYDFITDISVPIWNRIKKLFTFRTLKMPCDLGLDLAWLMGPFYSCLLFICAKYDKSKDWALQEFSILNQIDRP